MKTVEDLLKDIEKIGEKLTNLPFELLETGLEILPSIVTAAPQDTGSLKRSLNFYIEGDYLKFKMIYYAPFQNYGVLGTKVQRTAFPVPLSIPLQPRVGNIYSFDPNKKVISAESGLPFGVRMSINQRGLLPKPFFDIDDLRDKMINELRNRFSNL